MDQGKNQQQTGFMKVEVFSSVQGTGFFQRWLDEINGLGWVTTQQFAVQDRDYRSRKRMIGRLWLRWRMYGLFAWNCCWSVWNTRATPVLRIVTTNPFFAPTLVQWAAKGSGKSINLLYDLYPDALVHAGVLRENSWLVRRSAAITRAALRECDVTVFLGERLRRHAESRYGAARRAVVIPVGADGRPFQNRPPGPIGRSQEVCLLYSGLMGRMHDVETICQALRDGVPAGLKIRFHASGVGYADLRGSDIPGGRCEWGGPLQPLEWQQAMLQAHVSLVTIAPGAEDVVMPSKTYSALVAGQAILAICPQQSDLADLVRQHDCGWVVAPGDVAGLQAVLTSIAGNSAEVLRKRLNAYTAGHEKYDMTVIAKIWDGLLRSLSPMYPDESCNCPRC